MVRLLTERAEHGPAVERLVDAAFGEARWHKTCQRLRDGQMPVAQLSLVALDGEKLVGTVRLWTVKAGRRRALLLGPLAIDQKHRDRGIGAALIEEAILRAEAAGEDLVLLVGDAPYYARFGFRADATSGLWLPGPVERARFLAKPLTPAAANDPAQGPVLPLAA
jgi:predicted N-acetyltransferase YhbS